MAVHEFFGVRHFFWKDAVIFGSDDVENKALRAVAVQMMAIDPQHRPQLLRKVEQEIASVLL